MHLQEGGRSQAGSEAPSANRSSGEWLWLMLLIYVPTEKLTVRTGAPGICFHVRPLACRQLFQVTCARQFSDTLCGPVPWQEDAALHGGSVCTGHCVQGTLLPMVPKSLLEMLSEIAHAPFCALMYPVLQLFHTRHLLREVLQEQAVQVLVRVIPWATAMTSVLMALQSCCPVLRAPSPAGREVLQTPLRKVCFSRD